jgi:Leucine-rich repeat (LRR) protein
MENTPYDCVRGRVEKQGMSAEDDAYEAALKIIAEALEAGVQVAIFDSPICHALTRIPPELSKLRALRQISLSNTQIADLAPLAGLTGLEIIDIDDTKVTDLAPLVELERLWHISIVGTGVSTLNALARTGELASLNLSRTAVTDLSPLSKLTELIILDLTHTKVSDLRPLTDLSDLDTLDLSETLVAELSPLARLTQLRNLSFNQTRVSDLGPLVGLTDLQNLSLNQTSVRDLRPICGAAGLGSGRFGIQFKNTPATDADAELMRLSKIDDDEQRSRETLAYLKTLPPWPEPYTPKARPDGKPPQPIGRVPEPPKQDPALPLIWGEKGFTFLAQSIDADPVTEAALEDLRALLEDLRRKGNRHDDLYRLAGELLDRASGPIADLNMVKLHLSYQKLRQLYQSRDGRSERFDDETVTVLGSVLEIVPGVTLADANVKVLIARQEADRTATPPAADIEAENAVLRSIQREEAPFDPFVKDVAGAILEPGQDDRLSATRKLLSNNVTVAVLTNIALAPVTGPIGNYVYEHGADLLAVARTMGDDAYFWAQMVFATFKAEYQVAMGIVRETVTSGRIGRQPKE